MPLRRQGNSSPTSIAANALGEHVIEDYRICVYRSHFFARRIPIAVSLSHERLARIHDGQRVIVSGLVLVRQRPGTASGVIFMTLEDETWVANIIVWPKVFEIFRPIVLGARLISVTGMLQAESGVIHVVADQIEDLTPLLKCLAEEPALIDELAPAADVHAVMPRGRNFH